MKNHVKVAIVIALTLFFAVRIAFSEDLLGAANNKKTTSALREVNGELVTPRGNIHVGTSKDKLYDIFHEQDRILVPQAALGKECHVFRDWTSKNPNDTVTFFVNADKVTGWHIGYVASCQNKDSKYEYDNNSPVGVWFFPKDKARWDGTKVGILDWNKFTQAQKVMFIKEYVEQMNLKYKTNITVNIDKYILGMNYFCDNCIEYCKKIPAGDAVNNLLISDGKAKEKALP